MPTHARTNPDSFFCEVGKKREEEKEKRESAGGANTQRKKEIREVKRIG
jgi:hypothetical protein